MVVSNEDPNAAHLIGFWDFLKPDAGKDTGNLIGRSGELLEILAKNLDRHVTADTGDQLVEAHLDRLAELEIIADQAR